MSNSLNFGGRSIQSRLYVFSPVIQSVVWCSVILLLLSPVAVSYTRVTPTWDEIYFLHRATCLNRSLYALDWTSADLCLREMSKSPIMALLLLPVGPVEGMLERLSIAPTLLAMTCFIQILVLLQTAGCAGMRRSVFIVAAATAGSLAPVQDASAPFLADGLLSLVVTNTFLLLITEPTALARSNHFYRGLIWGFVFSCGILTKLTYFYFAAFCLPILVSLSLVHSGLQSLLWKLLGISLVIFLPLLLFTVYGHGLWLHAASAAFGDIAAFYDDGRSRLEFLQYVMGSLGIFYIVGLSVLLGLAIFWPSSSLQLLLVAWSVVALASYFWLASGSMNKDLRFFWPVCVALPFVLSGAVQTRSPHSLPFATIVIAALVAGIISLPSTGRQDLSNVATASSLLRSLPAGAPLRVDIATDEPNFNIETLLLSRELYDSEFSRLSFDTVVYDITRHLSPGDSLQRLLTSDAVILRDPLKPGAPEWANRFQRKFSEILEKSCSQHYKFDHATSVFRGCSAR